MREINKLIQDVNDKYIATTKEKDNILSKKASLEKELQELKKTFDDEKNQLDIDFEEAKRIVEENNRERRRR